DSQVLALRRDATAPPRPSLVVWGSHPVAYWVQVQPPGGLLREALDGGEKLGEEVWPPLPQPNVHRPAQGPELGRKIAGAWENAKGASHEGWGPYSRDDPYDIRQVLRAFAHAADREECVVSALQPPADAARARRVRMPFVSGEQAAKG